MKKILCIAVLALTFASAAEAVVLLPASGGDFEGSFVQDENGIFFDTFSFSPSSLTGDVTIKLTPLTGSINFFTALLNDQGFSFLPELGSTSFDLETMVTADQPLQLQVFGFSGDPSTLTAGDGSYSGQVSISLVPEPSMPTMMLFGLGALSVGVRRRIQRSKKSCCPDDIETDRADVVEAMRGR